MKFKLRTSGTFYQFEEDRNRLSKIGFRFEPSDYLKFTIIRDNDLKIEINTLEELIQFTKKYGEVIIDKESIEIYDNYRE